MGFKIEKNKSKENNKKFGKQDLTFCGEYSIVFIKEVGKMENFREYISAEPKICHGQPCFKVNGKPTRIMLYLVLEMLEVGETPEQIIRDAYPQLSKEHIQAALHFAAEIIKHQEYIAFTEA